MHPQLLTRACNLFQTSPDDLFPLSGGFYNAVYQFPRKQTSQVIKSRDVLNTHEISKFGVLRIGVEDCPAEQTLGMLEWARFLADRRAPVAAPILSSYGHLMERMEIDGKAYTITAFEAAEGTLAERIPPNEWSEELFQSIGNAVGKIHAASKLYYPARSELIRPQWFDGSEIHEAARRLTGSNHPARQKLAGLISELKLLPSGPNNFGLIHDDLHFANFLIQPDGKVTVIDFDDCVYGWFVMDVAMALFDILVLYHAHSEEENQAFARYFMRNYLTGYRRENELDSYWQRLIPRFLKLKELCVYAALIGHPDIDDPDSWVGRFMSGRSERIANDIPYVDINFGM